MGKFPSLVFDSKIFDFIKDYKTMLEREPLEKLAKIGELVALLFYLNY